MDKRWMDWRVYLYDLDNQEWGMDIWYSDRPSTPNMTRLFNMDYRVNHGAMSPYYPLLF